MRFIPVIINSIYFIIFQVLFLAQSFAQTNQTESLTISTYYPAPVGVYSSIKLVPRNQPSGPGANQTGTLYVNNTGELHVYVNNTSKWIPVGSGGSGYKIESAHLFSPDTCLDSVVYPPPASPITPKKQLCDWDGWYSSISFTKNFTDPPYIMVTVERNPSPESCPCCANMSQGYHVFATDITNKSFTLQAAGGVGWNSTCGGINGYDGRVSRIDVGWIAIGN